MRLQYPFLSNSGIWMPMLSLSIVNDRKPACKSGVISSALTMLGLKDKKPSAKRSFMGRIDTGATFCALPWWVGEKDLGLVWEDGEKWPYRRAGQEGREGQAEEGRRFEMTVHLTPPKKSDPKISFPAGIVFVQHAMSYAILGQADFLQRFRLTVDYADKTPWFSLEIPDDQLESLKEPAPVRTSATGILDSPDELSWKSGQLGR